jgi:hypothetical protein
VVKLDPRSSAAQSRRRANKVAGADSALASALDSAAHSFAALAGECGAEAVAAQALEAVAIVFVHGHVGVQREAGDERRARNAQKVERPDSTPDHAWSPCAPGG